MRSAAAGSDAGASSRSTTREYSASPGHMAASAERCSAARFRKSESAAASVARQSALSDRSAASSGPAIGCSMPVAVAVRKPAARRARTLRRAASYLVVVSDS